jgi:predicted amino acid racemase
MFLDTIARRNPDLIRAAIALHQGGAIPPNTYLLDLDAIRRNARLIKQAAGRARLQVYPMTKQVGRNPHFLRALARAGMAKMVAVDWMETLILARQRAQIGHVGHLVQIPCRQADRIAALSPEVWTVFNLQKAREVSDAAQRVPRAGAVRVPAPRSAPEGRRAGARAGRVQDLLLRVVRPGDTFYPTHDGGFALEDVVSAARQIAGLANVRVVGVTSFPTLLLDPECHSVYLTPNMETIVLAAERLRRELGLEITQINAPGTTSSQTMAMLAAAGATHVEPGHGFTGTTPWHAHEDLPELPAICYLTEVTDIRQGQAYVLGGGLYVDPVIPPYQVRALVGRTGDQALDNIANADLGSPAGIDYYALLDCAAPRAAGRQVRAPDTCRSAHIEIGDSVVFGFRAQAFVTRAHVAVIRGISRGQPTVAGLYDITGNKIREAVP